MILSLAKPKTQHHIQLFKKEDAKNLKGISKNELAFIQFRLKEGVEVISFYKDEILKILAVLPEQKDLSKYLEKCRLLGFQICKTCNEMKISEISVHSETADEEGVLALCEGLILSNYQFNKYKTGKRKFKVNSLKSIHLDKKSVSSKRVKEVNATTEAVYFARTLVNEPLSYLTAVQYSKDMTAAGKKYGFKVTVWDEKKIRAKKMGGVLAVNKGSVQPATFNILEYKPDNAKNTQPTASSG